MKRILTGVQSTGMPHIGNYMGAIKPAIELAQSSEVESMLFIADYHSLTSLQDPEVVKQYTYEVAATWLACGLDPKKSLLYRQSDIPELFELSWILSCVTPKGFMNRAHSYKDKVAKNLADGNKDPDEGVNMGLYNYPILMSADILMFQVDEVPVGPDQVQHLEFTRDIAQKFNHAYGSEILKLPKAVEKKEELLIMGLDGRKMSKSYGNHIPLFVPTKKLRKLLMKIVTDSTPPEAPKDPESSNIFSLHQHFASANHLEEIAQRYQKGCGWGEAKQWLYESMEEVLAPMREIYDRYMSDITSLDKILDEGAQRAREISRPYIKEIRQAVIGRG